MTDASMPGLLCLLALTLASFTGDIVLAIVGCTVASLSAWASVETILLRRAQRKEIERTWRKKKV